MRFYLWFIRRPYFFQWLHRLAKNRKQAIPEMRAYRSIYYDYEKRYHNK